ncbi:Dimethyl-sulfide monooxygenase [Rhodovastum atsumiense]|uniref:LLM class flavin-dependent oxidoreductase n=1 Tax=Rhodovastum atsumiense TaxID=504468 RepID=A0A5M6INN9_9PROT|nr:LLM class flavin-dependent oxidoreductase [Rhodovastum atsumiense]KAA5609883.1 LLM class flavin-dependent oxidoreductase [Rhodovastum atsumiense]CAH2602416.1 Dimethyl-sulfide monooxygenase [Rhodovastum atsumiense]
MARHIRLNAFDMNCVGHIQHGLWTHPRDRSDEYNTLGYWQHLARTAERGLFDGIFLADILGVYDVYRGSADAAIRNAVQIPLNDPTLLVPAMAAVTQHLGFGVTANLTYEPPYLFARRMSTLDHLTGGRVGWNIVTGYLDSAARGLGLTVQPAHDSRYDVGDEYMEVVYKLWEGSWEADAVLRDRAARVFARPEKLHRIVHQGRHFTLDAVHLSEPSPQRTPVLYQAGSSTRGRIFAARHAECVFVSGQTRANTRGLVTDLRERAAGFGRDPAGITIFAGATVVVAPTGAEARDLLEEYRSYASVEGALAHFSSSTGVDFSRYDLDEPIQYRPTDANVSALEAITTRSAEPWTLRRLIDQMVLGSRTRPIVGSPVEVADELQAWVAETGVDGFNLSRTVTPESLEAFVDLVVPELQNRGVFKTEYAPGTLREKLQGPGRAHLPAEHVGASFRKV